MALVLGQKWPPDPTAEKAVERANGGAKEKNIAISQIPTAL
jgi:hypothetical protein